MLEYFKDARSHERKISAHSSVLVLCSRRHARTPPVNPFTLTMNISSNYLSFITPSHVQQCGFLSVGK